MTGPESVFVEAKRDLMDLQTSHHHRVMTDRAVTNLARLLAGYERRISTLEKQVEELKGSVDKR